MYVTWTRDQGDSVQNLPERSYQTVAALSDAVDATLFAAEKRLVSNGAQQSRPAA